MALVKFNNTFPSFVDEFFGGDIFDSIKNSSYIGNSIPAINVKENEKDFEIQLAAPGLKKENFKIEVDKNILSISSEIKDESEEEKGKYTRREFRYQSFNRTFTLPETVDQNAIQANYKEGVLSIAVPKKEEKEMEKSRLIDIA